MKWNGQALDLIHQNLSLPINLDNAKESIIVDLPDKIWSLILKFLPLQDVLSLKFLSKRFYRISFFEKKSNILTQFHIILLKSMITMILF